MLWLQKQLNVFNTMFLKKKKHSRELEDKTNFATIVSDAPELKFCLSKASEELHIAASGLTGYSGLDWRPCYLKCMLLHVCFSESEAEASCHCQLDFNEKISKIHLLILKIMSGRFPRCPMI